jgi:hypothetical protein
MPGLTHDDIHPHVFVSGLSYFPGKLVRFTAKI